MKDIVVYLKKMEDKDQAAIDNSLILSSVRASWGLITPSLRSVSIEQRDNRIVWQCIFDKDANEDDYELMSIAAGEVIADFSKYDLEEIIKIIPSPLQIENLKNLIYLRHE